MTHYDLPDGWHTVGFKKIRVKDGLAHYSNGPAVISPNPEGGYDHAWYVHGRCYGINTADNKSFYSQEQFEVDKSIRKGFSK